MSRVALVRATVPFDEGIARRLIAEMKPEHPSHGPVLDFLAEHDADCPEDEEKLPLVGWVSGVAFWVDRDARRIYRWTITSPAEIDDGGYVDQEFEDRLTGGGGEDA